MTFNYRAVFIAGAAVLLGSAPSLANSGHGGIAGHTHGAEAAGTSFAAYAIGFLVATAVLYALGFALRRRRLASARA